MHHMSGTFTARVSDENLAWLADKRTLTGLSLGRIMDLLITDARERGVKIQPLAVKQP